MGTASITSRLQPWLQRWSVHDLAHAERWLANMFVKTCDAHEFLVHAGDHSDVLYLLDSGLVRLFYTTPDGKERNKAFYTGGDVTGPVSAAMTAMPAPFSIQCLEPSELIGFHFNDLRGAASNNTELASLYRDLLAEAFIRNERREALLLTRNAEQRYRWLLEHESELLERVPQFHIASYLGVDAVSLSRLKSKCSS